MKVKVSIEEIITKSFEVEVSNIKDAKEEIKRMYQDKKLDMSGANVLETSVMICDKAGNETEWDQMD